MQQRRINTLADHILEHLLAFGFFYRHRVTQLAIDVERKTAYLLAVEQGELQFAFEHAPVGIEEGHLHRGLRAAAADFGLDAYRLQHHGRFRALRHRQSRRRNERTQILRRHAVNQIERASGNRHRAHV